MLDVPRRVGQGIDHADYSTSDLSNLESSIRGCPSMCVIIPQFGRLTHADVQQAEIMIIRLWLRALL
jgi:hypothetical protein